MRSKLSLKVQNSSPLWMKSMIRNCNSLLIGITVFYSTSISNCTSEWPLCRVGKYPKATGFVHSGPTQRTSRNVDVSAEQVSKNDIFLT